MRFKVIISNGEDGWLVVECPSLPGCVSQGRTVEEGIRLCRLFLDMIRGKVTDDESLEELEAAITLKDISKMPVRVKCATLGWHTLEMALTRIEKQLSEQK